LASIAWNPSADGWVYFSVGYMGYRYGVVHSLLRFSSATLAVRRLFLQVLIRRAAPQIVSFETGRLRETGFGEIAGDLSKPIGRFWESRFSVATVLYKQSTPLGLAGGARYHADDGMKTRRR
jgi:hypothetical protein